MRNILISIMLASVVSSCATQINLPYRNKVNVVGRNTNINVENIITSNDKGYLQLQAVLTNEAPGPQQVYYRCVFYSVNGMQISDNVQWNPVQIFGQSAKVINCQSIDKTAIDYKIELSTTGDAMQVYK